MRLQDTTPLCSRGQDFEGNGVQVPSDVIDF